MLPVLIEFREKKDRNELYGVCRFAWNTGGGKVINISIIFRRNPRSLGGKNKVFLEEDL